MSEPRQDSSPREDPRDLLGVSLEAGDEEIRAAYLRKIKEFPPDRCPEEFEKVRDAHDLLRDPRRRTEWMLFSAEPESPLLSLLEEEGEERAFVGPEPWLAALKEE